MSTKTKRLTCTGCQLARINGVVCHEHGCPDAWKGERRECPECGTKFAPEHRHQRHCDASCQIAYTGLDYETDGSDE